MDTDKLNRWLALGANLGVLIGLAILVFEIGQNRDMMRAQVRSEVASQAQSLLSMVASDPELSDVLVKANRGDDLTESERTRHTFYRMTQFRVWEHTHYQYRIGLFDDTEIEGIRETWRSVAERSPDMKETWCFFRLQTSAEFRSEIDAIIGDQECS